MTKMTQKECVYERVCEVARQFNMPVDTELGEKIRQNRLLMRTLRYMVEEDFEQDRVKYLVKVDDWSNYVKGLVNNWLVKDRRIAPPYEAVSRGRPLSTDQGDILYIPKTLSIDMSLIPESLKHLVKEDLTVTKMLEDYRGMPTYTEVVCECGAKHTSNPSYHLSWCPLSK